MKYKPRLGSWAVALPPRVRAQETAGLFAGGFTVLDFRAAVDKNPFYPAGQDRGLVIRGEVADFTGIEKHDIRKIPLANPAPAFQTKLIGRKRRHFTDSFAEPQRFLGAKIPAENSGESPEGPGMRLAASVRNAVGADPHIRLHKDPVHHLFTLRKPKAADFKARIGEHFHQSAATLSGAEHRVARKRLGWALRWAPNE